MRPHKEWPPPYGRRWHRPHWYKGRWRDKRHHLFFRFFMAFGLVALLVAGGMAIVAFLLTRLFNGGGATAVFVWVSGCSLALALPILALTIAIRAFRGIAVPLADVMAAADAVAEGDLSVRISEARPGEFGRLAGSFNRMTAELERADQQRRNLTADVAHELRTPLHIIQGNLEGVLDGVYDPSAEHIQATLDETHLLARLVDDLQTLSLAESGQLPLHRESIDVYELLADVHTSFSGQAEAAEVVLQVVTPKLAAPLMVWADVGRLDQVLSNLVINGLRHTPPGGTLSLGAAAVDGGVCITVADTGEGIPAADLPYIFDRFWRGDRARSHAGGAGSGLGLAIARQLVRAHNGRVTVTSTVPEGTTFTIELPVHPP